MDPYDLSPEEKQRIVAEALRGQTALKQAGQRAGRFDNLAAISQLINNKQAASAAQSAQEAATVRNKPLALGGGSFALPGTGEMIASPGYVQERLEGRAQQRGLAQDRMLQSAQLQQERLAAQQQAQLDRQAFMGQQNDLNRALRGSLAAMAASKKGADGEGKALPYSAIKDITAKEGVRDTYTSLAGSFKPEFAGTAGLAPVENLAGKYFPGISGKGEQSNWWQNYAEQSNMVRKELFGSALTAPEKAAFEAATISPGMDAKQVQTRLGQQAAAADRAYRKIVGATQQSGYNTSGFSGGMAPAPVQAMPPGSPGGGGVPSIQLPPGFKLIGPAQ